MKMKIEIDSHKAIDTIYIVKGLNPFKIENCVDSFLVSNNKTKIQFPITESGYYILRTSLSKGVNLLSFVASPNGNAKLLWSIDEAKQTTTKFYKNKTNKNLYEKLTKPAKHAVEMMNSYFDSIYRNPIKIDSLQRIFYSEKNKFWADSLKKIYFSYIKEYPKDFAALFFLNLYYRNFSEIYIKKFLSSLPNHLKKHSIAKELAENKFIIEKIKSFSAFSLKDTLGNDFNYSKYNNYIVLVDFWASWCKPCRENLPKIDSLRLKYNHHDFKILGVSIDENKDTWLKAVKSEKMEWENVHEWKGLKGMAAKFFKITTIPRYVLLGKGGVILNRDLNLSNADTIIESALK